MELLCALAYQSPPAHRRLAQEMETKIKQKVDGFLLRDSHQIIIDIAALIRNQTGYVAYR